MYRRRPMNQRPMNQQPRNQRQSGSAPIRGLRAAAVQQLLVHRCVFPAWIRALSREVCLPCLNNSEFGTCSSSMQSFGSAQSLKRGIVLHVPNSELFKHGRQTSRLNARIQAGKTHLCTRSCCTATARKPRIGALPLCRWFLGCWFIGRWFIGRRLYLELMKVVSEDPLLHNTALELESNLAISVRINLHHAAS